MFKALTYLRAYNVPHSLQGKNISPGWVGVRCPFCGDTSDHGGFAPEGYYSCWRCGWHPLEDIIAALEHIPYHVACERVKEFAGEDAIKIPLPQPQTVSTLKLPLGTGPMTERHKEYLRRRRFDPDQLSVNFHLLGTGPVGNHAWRIVAPIYFNGVLVSYQCRDITGKADLRYKSCARNLEVIPHKEILYNWDSCTGTSVIVVEGITDVWRMGDNTVATFGIKWTAKQLNLLAERFKKVAVLYDSEPQAQAQAVKMGKMLASRGVEVDNITLDSGDPSDLEQAEADKLKGEIL